MRFKNVNGDWRIQATYGPEGQRRRHIGLVDGSDWRPVYASVTLNLNSVEEITKSKLFGSPRAAKAWVKEQIRTAA